MKKGVEGIRICCSGRSKGAEIARTECGKYGKTSRNVFNQKIDYAPAEVSTRYGISDVVGVANRTVHTQSGFGRYGSLKVVELVSSYRAIEAARVGLSSTFPSCYERTIPEEMISLLPGNPQKLEWEEEKETYGLLLCVHVKQILFEMDGVSLSNARQAATLAAHKPCSSTKFVQSS
ncbi:hypothetical protein Leryth_024561 [Lithospermum erythrorhizon]|nr:hypothetical protein Leryth_024561 [Lithospermum erythrorhizon]